MSDARRLRPVVRPEPDIRQIIQEAQTRWLKPLEVCEILRNYQTYNFKLNPVPPNRPPGGSLYLFDRKALRYFRKDGHNWRKKKDGKTVREAHERLKAGCVDVLHCYYAHGEENPNFQRRSYWMLEGAYEHIVLVHYLEVSQANRFRPSRDHSTDGATRQEALVANSISQPNAAYPSPTASELEVNGPMSSDVTGSTMSSEVEDVDSDGEIYDLEHENGPLVEQGVDYKDISTDWSSLLTSMSYSNQQLPLNVQCSQLLSNREPHQTVSSSEMDLADLLKNPDLLGPKPISSAVTLDLSGWNQLLGPTGPNKVVPKEEINYSSWEEILQQCTTPSTSQEILRSIQIKQEEAWSPMNVNDINATTSMSPKGLIDALSPRGLGREPQTVLEKYLRDATEENALKAAAEAHRRWTPQQTSQTQQIDIQRPSQKMGTQEMSSQQGWMSFSKQPMQNENEQLYPSGLNGWNYSLQQPKDQNKLEMGQQMLWQGKKIIHTEQQHAKDLNVTDHEEPLKDFKSNMSFKKVDSFNQWFMNEIGDDEPISRQADSGSLWMTSLEDEGAVEEISSQLQLEMGLNTSISQVQRFTISDFSPDWGFSSSEVKVLVTGKFLNTVRSPSDFSWCCMFGEVEVPAELVNDNVLRCKAPPHAPGRVPFYVTCSNRLACSEVREFEYRLKPDTSDLRNLENGTSQSEQELSVQISLTQMLLGNGDVSGGRTYSSSISNEELIGLKCLVENHRIQPIEMKEKLLQVFLKDKLKNWLMGKDGQAISILNENGQGIVHMVAAVGYDWAIPSILESGLVVNFRDSHGWTALHWAAAFGREKTILALLAAGAGAGLVTDPTPKYPSGQTPADLASQSGHKGISGFLAEKALTGHLSALTIREGNVNELTTISAAMQADHAMNAIRNNVADAAWGTEEQLALQRSLSAVRNATQAAALIHAAFRQVSFREKNLIPEELGDLGLLYEEMQAINAANKIQKAYRGHRQKLHLAAVQIQRKFRGWVRRKEFLKLRKHVVRIQAHVRGHQVRKKYRKILWSVGILEKAVLRWRRKRVGLRGFHLENSAMETTEEVINSDDDDFLKEGRKQKEAAFEKAVTRVHSMARSDVARAQYRRLREDFPLIERQLKSQLGGQDGAI